MVIGLIIGLRITADQQRPEQTGGAAAVRRSGQVKTTTRAKKCRMFVETARQPVVRSLSLLVLEPTLPVIRLARSRCAADASREVVGRWLLDGLDISVGHRRYSRDPSSKNDAGGTPAS